MTVATSSVVNLRSVAAGLKDGRLSAPFSAIGLTRLGCSTPASLANELNALAQQGFGSAQLALLLETLASERERAQSVTPKLELVVTGPDVRAQARDTGVVVEQLFVEARESVLVVGFALYDGSSIFRRLSERFDQDKQFQVTLCLDISRRGLETARDSDIIARFADDFRARHWSGRRLPEVYFDPRALASDGKERAVLHAKCIVADKAIALITSANPTPAAYRRNIEAGVVIRGGTIPRELANHFSSLISAGMLRKLPF